MSLVQRDYILRMIALVAAAIARAVRRREEGDAAGARTELRGATRELLGPAADLVGQVDPRTAANIIGDPQRMALFARLLHADAEFLRILQRPAEGDQADRRALALLLEARQRDPELDDEALALLETLRSGAPPTP